MTELRVFYVLAGIALAIPLVWSAVDQRRRTQLKATAYALCAAHRRDLSGCMHLHPGPVLHPQTYQLCRRLHHHSECAEFSPRRSP